MDFGKKRNLRHTGRRLMSLFLCMVMAMSMLGTLPFASAAAATDSIWVSDTATDNGYKSSLGYTTTNAVQNGGLYVGRIWSDKTVRSNNGSPITTTIDGNSITSNAEFQVEFSTIASTNTEIIAAKSPMDVSLAIDMSRTIDELGGGGGTQQFFRLQVDAVNTLIDRVLSDNPNSRVAVSVYGAGGKTILPLGRYTVANTSYGSKSYLRVGDVSTREILTNVTGMSDSADITVTSGITSLELGYYLCMKPLADATSTTVTINGKRISRQPVAILLANGGASTVFKGSITGSDLVMENGAIASHNSVRQSETETWRQLGVDSMAQKIGENQYWENFSWDLDSNVIRYMKHDTATASNGDTSKNTPNVTSAGQPITASSGQPYVDKNGTQRYYIGDMRHLLVKTAMTAAYMRAAVVKKYGVEPSVQTIGDYRPTNGSSMLNVSVSNITAQALMDPQTYFTGTKSGSTIRASIPACSNDVALNNGQIIEMGLSDGIAPKESVLGALNDIIDWSSGSRTISLPYYGLYTPRYETRNGDSSSQGLSRYEGVAFSDMRGSTSIHGRDLNNDGRLSVDETIWYSDKAGQDWGYWATVGKQYTTISEQYSTSGSQANRLYASGSDGNWTHTTTPADNVVYTSDTVNFNSFIILKTSDMAREGLLYRSFVAGTDINLGSQYDGTRFYPVYRTTSSSTLGVPVESYRNYSFPAKSTFTGTKTAANPYGVSGTNMSQYLMSFADKAHVITSVNQLQNVFDDIYSDVASVTQNPLESSSGSTNVVYTDPIGEYMEVKSVDAVLLFGRKYSVTRDSQGNFNITPATVTHPVYGTQFNTSDIKIKVMQGWTGDDKNRETLTVTIPSSAMPSRHELIRVDTDGNVRTFDTNEQKTDALPLRVVYSVGMKDVVMNGGVVDKTKIAANYIRNHTINGDLCFYAGYYDANDNSGYGGATVTFSPGDTNKYYYAQENYEVYRTASNGAGIITGHPGGTTTLSNRVTSMSQLSGSTKFYVKVGFYRATSTALNDCDYVEYAVEMTGAELSKICEASGSYVRVKLGSVRQGVLARFAQTGQNQTGTSQYYYVPTYSNQNNMNGQSTTSANITTYLGNNGRRSVGQPDLAVTKRVGVNGDFPSADNKQVDVGDVLDYAIDVRNNGRGGAMDITVRDTIPAGLTYVQGSATGNPTISTSGGLTTLEWTIASIGAQSQANALTYQATVNGSAKTMKNSVTASYPGGPVTPDGDDVTVTLPDGNAAIELTKTQAINGGAVGASSTVRPGDRVTYYITAKNSGQVAAANVVITDTIPAGLTLDQASISSPGSYNSGTGLISWSVGNIAPGGTQTVSFSCDVPQSPSANRFTNIASANFSNNPGSAPTKSNDVNLDSSVIVGPSLQLSKTSSVGGNDTNFVEPGDVVKYTITVRNVGSAAATNVVITDTLPTGLKNPSNMNPQGTYNSGANTIAWNVTSIAAGETKTFTFDVTIPADAARGTSWVNRVTATGPNLPDTPASGENRIEISEGQPNIRVTKTASSTSVQPGEYVTYSIDVENTGTGAATNVTVTDNVPAGLVVDTASISNGGTYNSGTHKVTWSLPDIAPKSKTTVTFRVRIPAANVGASWTNSVDVSYKKSPNDPSQTSSGSATITVGSLGQPGISITKTQKVGNGNFSSTGTTSAEPGDTITYKITVVSTGGDTARNVVITDNVPAGLENITNISHSGMLMGRVITWRLGDMAPGAQYELTFECRIPMNPTVTSWRNVAQGTFDDNPNPTTPPEGESNVKLDGGLPNVQIVKTALDANGDPTSSLKVSAGDKFRYRIRVSNTGEGSAKNVVVRDTLPQGLTYVAGSANPTPAPESSGQNLIWNLGDIGAGDEVDIIFEVQAPLTAQPGQSWKNKASVDFDNNPNPGTPTEDDVTVEVADGFGHVTMTKTQSADGGQTTGSNLYVKPGATITYYITATSDGDAAASDVRIIDTVPDGLSLISSSISDKGKYDVASGYIIWDIGTMPVGSQKTVSFSVQIPASVTEGKFQNTAGTVFGNNPNNPGGLNPNDPATWPDRPTDDDLSNEVEIQVEVPNVTINKTKVINGGDKTGDSVVSGDVITYTIHVENSGSADAINVVVTDKLPNALTLLSKSISHNGSYANGVITWTFPRMAPGESYDLTFDMRVPTPVDLTKNWTNVANMTYDNDPNGGNGGGDDPEHPTDPVPVKPEYPYLDVHKTQSVNGGAIGQVASAKPGDVIKYFITAKNLGKAPAHDTVITDHLPAGVIVRESSISDGGKYYPNDGENGEIRWDIGTLEPGQTKTMSFEVELPDFDKMPKEIKNRVSGDSPDLPIVDPDNPPANYPPTDPDAPGGGHTNCEDCNTDCNYDGNCPMCDGECPKGECECPNRNPATLPPHDNCLDCDKDCNYDGNCPGCDGECPNGECQCPNRNPGTMLPPGGGDPVIRPEEPHPEVEIVKTMSVNDGPIGKDLKIHSGDTVHYQITVTNRGPGTAKDVVVTDILPNGLKLVKASVSDLGQLRNGNILVWNLGSLKEGDTKTLTFDMTVPTPIDYKANFSNSAYVDWFPKDGMCNGDCDSEGGCNSDGQCPDCGEGGNGCMPDGSCPGCDGNGDCHCPDPDHRPTCNGDCNSPAGCNWDGQCPTCDGECPNGCECKRAGPGGNNGSGNSTEPVTPEFSAPKLVLSKVQSVNDGQPGTNLTVKAGDRIKYIITVTNVGDEDAINTIINDTVPHGLELIESSISDRGRIERGWIRWHIGTLKVGESKTVSFECKVPSVLKGDESWTNKATVQCDNDPNNPEDYDPNKPKGSCDNCETDCNYDGNCPLCDGTCPEGECGCPDRNPAHNGGGDGNGHEDCWDCNTDCNYDGNCPLCDGECPKGECECPNRNPATNGQGDGGVSNEVNVSTEKPHVTLSKTQSINGGDKGSKLFARPGDVITYWITAKNDGDAAALGLVIMDDIPQGLTLVASSISDGGAYDETTKLITWKVGTLEAGAEITVHFDAKIPSKLDNGVKFQNTASMWYANNPENDPNFNPDNGDGANKTDQSNTVELVTDAANVDIKKVQKINGEAVDNLTYATAGDKITYEITVTSNGTADAENVIVGDTIPTGLILDETSISSPGKVEKGYIIWRVGDMKIGDKKTVSFTCTVPGTAGEGDEWSNVAAVMWENNPNNPSDWDENDLDWMFKQNNGGSVKSSNKVVFKTGKPVLESVKKAFLNGEEITKDTVAKPGEQIEYVITVKNNGTAERKNVMIYDPISNGLPVDLTSITDAGEFIEKDNTIVWTKDKLAAGDTWTVKFKVTLPNVAKTTAWQNVAVVLADDTDKSATNSVVLDELSKNLAIVQTGLENLTGLVGVAVLVMSLGGIGAAVVFVIRKKKDEDGE